MAWKLSEFEINGRWYCNCKEELGKPGNHWLYPARKILDMTPADYLKFVIDNFHPIVHHNEDCSLVFFSWEKQADEAAFRNYMNKRAEKRNYNSIDFIYIKLFFKTKEKIIMYIKNIMKAGILSIALTIGCSISVPASQADAVTILYAPDVIASIDIEENVYTTEENVELKQEPNAEATIVATLAKGTELYKVRVRNGWSTIYLDDNLYYIETQYTTATKPENVAEAVSAQIANGYYDPEDLRLLASLIYAEANNQSEAGMQAVGIVVMNRVKSDSFNNTISSVIYEKGQFTPVYDGSLKKALALYDSGKMFDSCIRAAKYAMDGNTSIVYQESKYEMGSFLFFATKMNKAVIRIQGHSFR